MTTSTDTVIVFAIWSNTWPPNNELRNCNNKSQKIFSLLLFFFFTLQFSSPKIKSKKQKHYIYEWIVMSKLQLNLDNWYALFLHQLFVDLPKFPSSIRKCNEKWMINKNLFSLVLSSNIFQYFPVSILACTIF